MKTPWLAAFTFILLVSASTARGDAASKAQLLDQFVKLNASDAEGSLKRAAADMINRDPRIQPTDRAKHSSALEQSVSKEELFKRVRDISDQKFTEEELKYIVALLGSDIFSKMNSVGEEIAKDGEKFAKEQVSKNFEQVTGIKYQESFPAPEPGWLAKMIWKWIPGTQSCPAN